VLDAELHQGAADLGETILVDPRAGVRRQEVVAAAAIGCASNLAIVSADCENNWSLGVC
jgi:hypothetical protein